MFKIILKCYNFRTSEVMVLKNKYCYKEKKYIQKVIEFHKRENKKVIETLLFNNQNKCIRCGNGLELTKRGLIQKIGGIAEIQLDVDTVVLYTICQNCKKEYVSNQVEGKKDKKEFKALELMGTK